MVLLDEADVAPAVAYLSESVYSPDGTRPRSMPSLSTGGVANGGTDPAAIEDAFAHDGDGHQQPSRVCLRAKPISKFAAPPSTSTAKTSTSITSNATDIVMRPAVTAVADTCDDAFAEAEAMAADEARSSPPSSLPHDMQDGHPELTMTHRPSFARKKRSTNRSSTSSYSSSARLYPSHSASTVDGAAASFAATSNVISAPAYEPANYAQEPCLPPFRNLTARQQNISESRRDTVEVNVEDGSGGPEKRECLLIGTDQIQASLGDGTGAGREDGFSGTVSRFENRPHSPGIAREAYFSAMSRSGEACQSVREDLTAYMEGVRGRRVRRSLSV